MDINDEVKSKIDSFVKNNRVVLFMKGTPQQPQCGFSAKTVAALDSVVPDYISVNVLDDPEIREGIKVYGNWPTIPQLYIDGELVGGCDIILNMLNSGELHQSLGLKAPDRTAPEITVTPAAAEKIMEAMQGHEGIALHFEVNAAWDAQFNLAPPQGNEIASESNGIKVLMDIGTAQRARGAVIDWVSTMQGEGLAIDLPQAPAPVKQMTVQELAGKLKDGDITLVDIRGADERSRATIEGAQVLDQDTVAKLEQLPKDSALAFLCHHGNSSMGAAEYFRKQGFTDVSNVAGGIHAWSMEVDSSVPTY
ncbi:MAG: Grx4 family monothiol glutaredoxin [Xanthomonadales bacterium]|nr:Grx4 family monothiol glutaredoxin [Gammaproteobacteria bacterium]MBT8052487.1 Grx4 family monothiol glutaredoxin [Gammaproteobacteria bacterium]NND57139.1 Grx4 family monothiol glutaredoxin [Xanthomonadales bacterium]NNK52789.1 Grx4 family monothiol glutaredoxin [Xanthomonadales bacterium]